jgi:hypothetical protein
MDLVFRIVSKSIAYASADTLLLVCSLRTVFVTALRREEEIL